MMFLRLNRFKQLELRAASRKILFAIGDLVIAVALKVVSEKPDRLLEYDKLARSHKPLSLLDIQHGARSLKIPARLRLEILEAKPSFLEITLLFSRRARCSAQHVAKVIHRQP